MSDKEKHPLALKKMAFQYVIAFSVVCLLTNIVPIDADSELKLFILIEQGRKLNHVFSTMATSSARGCCAECSRDDECVAISYNSRHGICNLNDRNPHDFPYFSGSMVSAWTSFGLKVECTGPGWVPYNRNCYTAVGQSMNWNAARDHCASIGGQLVDILDDLESQFVHGVASAESQRLGTDTYYWIGLHIVGDHTHGWVSGSPFIYNRWDGLNPSYEDPYGTIENCVEAKANREWNDVQCNAQMPISVCEKKEY